MCQLMCTHVSISPSVIDVQQSIDGKDRDSLKGGDLAAYSIVYFGEIKTTETQTTKIHVARSPYRV